MEDRQYQTSFKRLIQFFISDMLALNFNKRCSVPIFIGSKCGTYYISQPIDFHSIRRSGGVLVLFCYRKRTRPSRLLIGMKSYYFVSFVLKQKAPKIQERTILPPPRAKHLARRSFIPPHGYSASFGISFH